MSMDEAERIAQEYQDFAYIVSHDLNAPLRHVREFSRLLLMCREADGLSEDEKQYAGFINGALDRLDDMQKGLLSFSRITTEGRPFERVDVGALVATVIDNVAAEFGDGRDPVIDVEDLDDVHGDASQIYMVFYNVISNAVKFSKADQTPYVHVSSHVDGDNVVFKVRDQGIGVKDDHHEDVFKMFRQLHVAGTYAGSGVGLALCRKVMNRHGGSIKISGDIDEGTCVEFSCPKAA